MSETHTPGPWSHAHRKGDDGMYRTQVFDVVGETIATLDWYPFTNANGTISTLREANAHLIAAAPDLLESAKAVIAWFKALKQEQHERTVLGQTLESAAENWEKPSLIEGSLDLEPLMRAIAKAEGRS